jgi:mRNA interferase HigB
VPINVVARSRLERFWQAHPMLRGPLCTWYSTVSRATWTCFADVRKTYRSADLVGDLVVFNVAQGCRVVADVVYQTRHVYIKYVFTHGEYDKWTKSNR